MENEFTKELTINISHCGRASELTLSAALGIFMDTAALHDEKSGRGIDALRKDGLYQIIGQNRIKFFDCPRLMQKVFVHTYLSCVQKFWCLRNYDITDSEGRLLLTGQTQWILYSKAEKKMLPYGLSEGCVLRGNPYFEEKAPKPEKTTEGAEKVGEYTVLASDIDFIGHMNNSAYARLVQNFLSDGEKKLSACDIFYLLQCMEGERLSVWRRPAPGGEELLAVNAQGAFVMTARVYWQ